LIQVLDRIPKSMHPSVLVAFDTADDAGVFRLDDQRALVQTLDFFAPVVDDPFAYGAIAATNSLSDIYAMGGQPLTALSIACFPDRQDDLETLTQIMLGGADKLREAGVALLGGHSMCDNEIKFGYSVTGLIHPDKIMTNAGAQAGDALVLTKPLGLGIITTAIKRSLAEPETVRNAIQVMTTLNRTAAEVMLSFRSHAATDITGYGLLGHACEMAEASRKSFRFQAHAIPYISDAYALAKAGVLPGLVAKTWKLLEPKIRFGAEIELPILNILLDPQTSGGLLIAIHPDDRDPMLEVLMNHGVEAVSVGEVEPELDVRMIVE
jgi:selenide, water dikinase